MGAKSAETPDATVPDLVSGRGLQALERLAKLAASLIDCATAVVLFNQNGVSRIVCGFGHKPQYLSYRWGYETAPYKPDQQYIVADAHADEAVQQARLFAGTPTIGFFLRTPINVAPDFTTTLIVVDASAKAQPDEAELRILAEIVALMREELATIEPLLSNAAAHVSMAAPMTDLIARVEALPVAAALLTGDTKIVAINQAAAAVLGRPAAELIGKTQTELLPKFSEICSYFYTKALAEKISSPAIEISGDEHEGQPRQTYSIVATPLSPMGTDEYFLLVTGENITVRVAREDSVADAVADATHAEEKPPAEPSAQFLLETLVERRTIRNRNSVSYMTMRSWRQPVRKYQISALNALKQRAPKALAADIAREVAEGVSALVGTAAFKTVVPVPCGHSQHGDCLSVEVARSLAGLLNIPMVRALDSQRRKGRSHPRKNATRPPMELAHEVDGPVLLVDDVATSGAHLQEAVELLRPHCRSVLPVAWIGGDSTAD